MEECFVFWCVWWLYLVVIVDVLFVGGVGIVEEVVFV